mmetsp:Transcript_13511/g.32245  ORF Transcript_13511/g.32245 Transcript_13511/m.32245 type:complete len:392 (+) Transcript_13511:1500-2675(+)
MRPSSPLAAPYCACTLHAARCMMLCAKSDGGSAFDLARYSSLLTGSTSAPTFATKAPSPSSYSWRTKGSAGCTPKVPHGCWSEREEIGSRSDLESAASVRTPSYSMSSDAYAGLPCAHCECGTSMLNVSAAPDMKRTTTALYGRLRETCVGESVRSVCSSWLYASAWNSALAAKRLCARRSAAASPSAASSAAYAASITARVCGARLPRVRRSASSSTTAGAPAAEGAKVRRPSATHAPRHAPNPSQQRERPRSTSDVIPLRYEIISGAVPTCASGATSAASATAPLGWYSGRKKEKTLGLACAACPTASLISYSSTSRPSEAYSIARRKCTTLSSGSRSLPCAPSASSVGARASRSSSTAASAAARSPYDPEYTRPPYAPDEKAAETAPT